MTEAKLTRMEITHIPVRNLAVVWPEAQRPYNEAWAKEIAEAFDPDKFDPVKVTMPNGNGIYHICEGQHRVGAIRMLWGHDTLCPCLVAPEADPARAAEIFLDTNDNRDLVKKIAKFKVSVTAKRQEECAIDRICRHCGYRVEGSRAQDTVAAVDALKFVYRKGARTLDSTLHLLRDIWGGDPSATSAALLRGFGSFVCEFSEHMDKGRLREVVAKKYTPGKLVIDAKGVKELMHINSTEAVMHILLRLYNKGLHQSRQLKRKQGRST